MATIDDSREVRSVCYTWTCDREQGEVHIHPSKLRNEHRLSKLTFPFIHKHEITSENKFTVSDYDRPCIPVQTVISVCQNLPASPKPLCFSSA